MELVHLSAIICGVCVLVNLVITGHNIKMLTEYMKDRLQQKRKES